MKPDKTDITIIGGGIVGLGTALALSEQYPGLSLRIIEKEPRVADHQTGHNSGVIHAGIYYRPGSHKARLCVEGVHLLTDFCEANGIPTERCGKLIVAVEESQLARLESLYERGKANGVPGLEMVGPDRAHEIEPHAKAVRALYSPNTAIVDYQEVAGAMARVLAGRGVQVVTAALLRSIRRAGAGLLLVTNRGDYEAGNLINCAGLYSDRIARMMGVEPGAHIVPFRGEYYSLRPGCSLVKGLIYPVPDPEFPFLGVHFTRRIGGDYEAGPNAVLALAREGYARSRINLLELCDMLVFPGFWRMAGRYWRTGLYEQYRSINRRAFLRALQRLVPDLVETDLRPGGSGVRAQLVMRDGALYDDFRIVEATQAIHVLNAPSPAATASISIGRHIAAVAARSFGVGVGGGRGRTQKTIMI